MEIDDHDWKRFCRNRYRVLLFAVCTVEGASFKCKVANICDFCCLWLFSPNGELYPYRAYKIKSCIHSGVWSSGMILASGFSRPSGCKCERPWVRIPAHPDAAFSSRSRIFTSFFFWTLSPKFSFTIHDILFRTSNTDIPPFKHLSRWFCKIGHTPPRVPFSIELHFPLLTYQGSPDALWL